jgi:hypothetical protein
MYIRMDPNRRNSGFAPEPSILAPLTKAQNGRPSALIL